MVMEPMFTMKKYGGPGAHVKFFKFLIINN